jgi:hypothetical protein
MLQSEQHELLTKNKNNKISEPRPSYTFAVTPKKTGCECVDWTHLFQSRDQWHSLVSVVKKEVGNIWTN